MFNSVINEINKYRKSVYVEPNLMKFVAFVFFICCCSIVFVGFGCDKKERQQEFQVVKEYEMKKNVIERDVVVLKDFTLSTIEYEGCEYICINLRAKWEINLIPKHNCKNPIHYHNGVNKELEKNE